MLNNCHVLLCGLICTTALCLHILVACSKPIVQHVDCNPDSNIAAIFDVVQLSGCLPRCPLLGAAASIKPHPAAGQPQRRRRLGFRGGVVDEPGSTEPQTSDCYPLVLARVEAERLAL